MLRARILHWEPNTQMLLILMQYIEYVINVERTYILEHMLLRITEMAPGGVVLALIAVIIHMGQYIAKRIILMQSINHVHVATFDILEAMQLNPTEMALGEAGHVLTVVRIPILGEVARQVAYAIVVQQLLRQSMYTERVPV